IGKWLLFMPSTKSPSLHRILPVDDVSGTGAVDGELPAANELLNKGSTAATLTGALLQTCCRSSDGRIADTIRGCRQTQTGTGCARRIDKVASRGYLSEMRSVGLKVLKNKLSEFVRLAAAGETVVITDRGRVVAELVPPQPRTGRESFIERGVREGWLTPAK